MNTPFKYKVTVTTIVDCQNPEAYPVECLTAEDVATYQELLFQAGNNDIIDFLENAQTELTVVCEVMK